MRLSDTVFPESFVMPKEKVMEFVYLLLAENREDTNNGSDFAVTVNAQEGYWHLWLSETSYKYLMSFSEI